MSNPASSFGASADDGTAAELPERPHPAAGAATGPGVAMRTEGRGVRDEGNGRPSADRELLIRSAIRGWRDSLICLTAANRLLNFKPSRAGAIELARPGADDVLSRLRSGGTFTFRSLAPKPAEPALSAWKPATLAAGPGGEPAGGAAAAPPPTDGILDTGSSPDDLAAGLRALARRSDREYLDRGLSVLYLAFGTLTWADDDLARYTSPLLLVPVRLVAASPRQLPVLEPAEGDPVVNPALTLKLSARGITLPRVDDLDEVTLTGLLDAVRAAVAGTDGWQAGESVILSCFSFAREAMYRDLLGHEDLAVAHPAVGALAAGCAAAGTGFVFDEIAEDEIDTRAAPELNPVILDADSWQRAAIAAAVGGRSFVMDGPPGTGKSQTVANMIAAVLHAGKTVLFVSEKAAALDVVRNRLAGAGLDGYLLELHSHRAARKEVAASLGKALDTVPSAAAPMPRIDVDTARKRREQLNGYADAMNRPREPLGYSLHDIFGVIANLEAVPAAPATGLAPVADLTVEVFSEVRQTAATLAAAWRPAAQGRSFIWRGVTEQGSLDARLYQAATALEALAGMTRLNGALAEVTGLTRPSDAPALAGLLGHLVTWPELPDEWLTADSLDAAETAVAQVAATLSEITVCEDRATQAAGVPWPAIPQPGTLPAIDGVPPAGLTPACADPDGLTAEQITGLARAFAADADMLHERAGALSGLASMLGLRAPVTFGEAADLLAIAQLAEEHDRPERGWLSVPGHQAAREAVRALYEAHHALAKAEADASAYYTAEALHADAQGLALRFGGAHQGLGKLSTEYRADKRIVATFTREGVARETAQEQLGLAAAWKRAAQALGSVQAGCAPLLGPYYTGRTTDFDRLGRALNQAANALRRAHGQDLGKAGAHISRDALPNPAIISVAAQARQDLSAWQASLAPRPSATARPELLNGTIGDAIGWLRAHLGPLRSAAAFTHEVSEVVGRPLTFGQARWLVGLRDAADSARERLTGQSPAFHDVCGDLYAGAQTDVTALQAALEWARRLRAMITGGTGPLTPAHLKAAESAVPTARLPAAAEAWRQAKDALRAAFGPDRRAELETELDDYDDAADLIAAMFDDTGGRDEWHTYQAARASLATHGLDVAVDFCIAERVEPAQVPQVLERALLQEWAEHHIRTDPALAVVRAPDRDALVREYRELDRALIAAAAGDVIRACNARRPRSDIGEAAVIRREAEKKSKHMPVRVLIERARHVTQAIKPCFMMSPLSVSQYLPADLHFDVVIFDEASQVSPAGAINCIYRGSALILAGDARQLPPTSFFTGGAGDGEEWPEEPEDASDPESVLDLAKGSGAFRNLPLRWHYRSRHEALIAFSNAAFYEGRLNTFPGKHSDGPNVGVELFWVDGTYRRATSRDNPDEAAQVAERVIYHYDARPELSLGVVTFSEAQAEAVETAVAAARRHRPDLDRFFASDRLRGFFVKNVETVQGDERDVLIFSIGYGPDENRKITMSFGPLSRPGGSRRLNVAITRARYRNEIFSSIRAGDIPESVTSEGLRHLRRYLDYAARGLPALGLSAGADGESPFEESVIKVIRSWGYELTPRVGTAGYRIDIGIHYPSHPGVYALGVECDGRQYHSAKAARDRDRLREKVLRDLGWNLHRIWGTSWYRDRGGEERRLQAAIEHALASPPHGLPEWTVPPVVPNAAADPGAVPSWAVPYVTAAVPPLPHWVDPADPGSQFTMTDGIRAIVDTEGPVHVSILYERLRDAWNIGRVGTRIRDNIDAAIRLADVIRDGEFLTLADAPRPAVRVPTRACKRGPEQVDDRELVLALVGLVRDAAGLSRGQLAARVAQLYGWPDGGPDITSRMGALIAELRRNGTLAGDEQATTAAHAGEDGAGEDGAGAGGGAVAGGAAGWHPGVHDQARP
ncbi:MAG TPA: DUF3320 domain-containing protein [Streptosporangiaceae bacterium]|nr:DUF3320 domain-containing protein [Streptosporangiaceae bacterium]